MSMESSRVGAIRVWGLCLGVLCAGPAGPGGKAAPGGGPSPARTAVEEETGILENSFFVLQVDLSGGARVRSWKLKKSGRELIAIWKGAKEIGGAFDDRAVFTSATYRTSVMQHGPETAVLRCERSDPSGLRIVKTYTVTRGSPVLKVFYSFYNASQSPHRLFIRNFILPGSKPMTAKHLYWVNGEPTRKNLGPAKGSSKAAGYYVPNEPPYAALWDSSTGDGLLVVAPGINRFYFWRGSREFPTFEWVYRDVPAGKVLHASVALHAFDGEKNVPHWPALAAQMAKKLSKPRPLPIPGWVDEAKKFRVTARERDRGFWLSWGEREGKQRIPDPMELDLPAQGSRFLGITINTLKTFRATISVKIPNEFNKAVRAYLETPGHARLELARFPDGPVKFTKGSFQRAWLMVDTEGLQPGKHRIEIELTIGKNAVNLPLKLHIWPVRLAAQRPFHVRGYCGGFAVFTGGFDVTDEKLVKLEALLRAYSDIGGDVVDWNLAWNRIAHHVRIRETGEIVAEVARKKPASISLNALPRLDFSYYDPWLKLAAKYRVNRVETYLSHPSSSRNQWAIIDPLVGKGRVRPGTTEARKVIAWFYGQMQAWLKSCGMTGFFCKISDEISPEHIPAYIETAEFAREIGWRPFTTITGLIARTAKHINRMNPYCDEWQLSFLLKDDFLRLLKTRYETEEKRFELKGSWRPYVNGGARHTWYTKALGKESSTGLLPREIETLKVLEDGRELLQRGGSPWANKARGVFYTAGTLHEHLYVSPSDEKPPAEHKYELVVVRRYESAQGKPLARIDPTDEVWCYGGASRPFRIPYYNAWSYPVTVLYQELHGYGIWAFTHWQKTEKILWVTKDGKVTVSPAYCGFRDGWHDARIFNEVKERLGPDAFHRIVNESETSLLRVDFVGSEVYRYRVVVNAWDPVKRNAARRLALRLLSQGK